jgi:hypothetical protein
MSATQATSVNERFVRSSSALMPQKRPGSCRRASTDVPIIVPKMRIHQGKASAL